MKKAFILLSFLFSVHFTNAQPVVFSENFDELTSFQIIGWNYQQFTGLLPWRAGLPYQVGELMGGPMTVETGTNHVACICDIPDPGAPIPNDSNAFLFTPPINLSGISGPWLKYDSYFRKVSASGHTEQATVEVSVDGGNNWTIVQDVPAGAQSYAFSTYYLDLSAYGNTSDLRIGFRYKDHGGNLWGWAIDNVSVIAPGHNDISTVAVSPSDTMLSFVAQNSSILHDVTVYNAGLDTIHSFVAKYAQDNGVINAQTITGVSIPRFTSYTFTHATPDIVTTIGTHRVNMWAELPGDNYHVNDTAHTTLRGTYFTPNKKLLIEEGTATWDTGAPRGIVFLRQLSDDTENVCKVSIHTADPMTDTAYDAWFFNQYIYAPYCMFDRRVNVGFDSFFTTFEKQRRYFGFAELSITGGFNGGNVIINATINPAIDLYGDLRLAIALTEDDVTGSGVGWDQGNHYAGGTYGLMGGFESLANPVPASQMHYDNVARKITPSPDGPQGVVATPLLHGNIYHYLLAANFDINVWNPDKMKAIVLLLRNDDSTVLNCAKLPAYLFTNNLPPTGLSVGIYPNPAAESCKIFFDLASEQKIAISVTDITGRAVYSPALATYSKGKNEVTLPLHQLASGIYLVEISADSGRKTLKLEVVH